ncbi:MAG: TolC family protein [Pyrinomonadaceae bacterium]
MKKAKLVFGLTILFFGISIDGNSQTPITALTLDQAVEMALRQASNFEQAKLNELIADEDVFQAGKEFYPKISANPAVIYTTPSLARGLQTGTPRPPSFLGANAITEYQATAVANGEIDISGKLKANKQRALALFEAAKAGTEIARRDLIRATEEAYFGLAFAIAGKNAAQLNLETAQNFEKVTKLLVDGGEIPPVDLIKAQIQTTTRRDELEQARILLAISENNLKVYLNLDQSTPVAVEDFQVEMPLPDELAQFSLEEVRRRPELVQFEAQKQAAEAEAKMARAERRPQITYSLEAGIIADSLRPDRIGDSAGIRGTVGVNIPLFDWGASKSRQTQAELRTKIAESSRLFAQRQFIADFNSNFTAAKTAATRIRQLALNLQNSEKVLNVAIERYKAGETQIIEVTETQNLIVTERITLLQAIFDYQIAKARLRQATGK